MADARDWNFLREKLLPQLPPDSTYEQVLMHVKDLFGTKSLTELADLLAVQYKAMDPLEERLAGLAAIAAGLERIVIRRMEEMDIDSVKTSTGVPFSIDRQIDAKTLDNAKVLEWVKSSGREALLKMNAATLSAEVRRLVEAGAEVPEGIEVVPRNALKIPRAKLRKL